MHPSTPPLRTAWEVAVDQAVDSSISWVIVPFTVTAESKVDSHYAQ